MCTSNGHMQRAHAIIFLRMSKGREVMECCHLIVVAITTFIRAATHKSSSRFDLLTFCSLKEGLGMVIRPLVEISASSSCVPS